MDNDFIILLIIAVIFLLYSYINSNKVKGKRSESHLEKKIKVKSFFEYGGETFKNVYVPKENGEYAEIDMLYLTNKGIFVFENKNYVGYIFGNESYKEWTVSLYGGKNILGGNKVKKIRFYNPIWQNNSHIRSLRKYLNTDVNIYSIITFSDRSEIKEVTVNLPDTIVCHHSELNRYLKRIWNSIPYSLNEVEYQNIASMIRPLTNVSNSVKKAHIKNIKENIADEKSYSDICPSCGGRLVVRTARKGKNIGNQFYGCSNYPRCKFTRNM